MVDVVDWVLSGDTKTPRGLLDVAADEGFVDAILAAKVLQGVDRAADQERQSIWSATADVVDVYTTIEALEAATDSNFDPAVFVDSGDTVYVAVSAEQQNACAPLVVALIEAIRDAQYRRHRAATLAGQACWPPVSLILDEVANVAPIASLPALVSEAGGQGLHVLAAVQDLSQVKARWGLEVAEGFLSLFGHVLVLGGIRDTRTLEAFSVMCWGVDQPRPDHQTPLAGPRPGLRPRRPASLVPVRRVVDPDRPRAALLPSSLAGRAGLSPIPVVRMGGAGARQPHGRACAAQRCSVRMTGPVCHGARAVVRVRSAVGACQGPPSGGPKGTHRALDKRSLPAAHHGLGGPGTGPRTPPPFACRRRAVWTGIAVVRCGRFWHLAERDAYVWAFRAFVKQGAAVDR